MYILCRAAIAVVVASEVCLAKGELAVIERRGAGDLVRFTTQDGACRTGRCLMPAQTYILDEGEEEEGLCGADSSLQDSKYLYHDVFYLRLAPVPPDLAGN